MSQSGQVHHLFSRQLQSAKTSCIRLTLAAFALFSFSHAVHADIIGSTHTTLVSEFASFNTPGVVDGRVEAIAVDGDTVFVGGSFTQIHDPLSDEIIDQPYLFAYSKSSGDILRDFDPILNNDVFALEKTGEGTGVFVGGVFSNINGVIRRGLVKLDNNGDRVSGFGARPNASVKTMVRLNNTLYLGGVFDEISGTPVEHLAAIDTVTGAVDPNLNFDFEGVISTTTINGTQSVDELDITPDGQLLVVVGNFSTIDGISRPRLAVIELGGQATVSAWNTNVFDIQCPSRRFPQYILGMDISPDGSYFLTASTGFRIIGNPACDTTARYELTDLTNTDVQPTWVNYTGGDSVYEVVSTGHAVYIGGHFEFLDNDFGNGNIAGPGSSQRAGLAALDPLNGLTIRDWQSDRSPRGLGVFALLSEDEGVYFGDDTDFLNGTEHEKLKFLPLSSNAIARPDAPTLPTTIITTAGNSLVGSTFNGTTPGAAMQLLNSGWQNARGGMFVGGRLFHADDNGTMFSSEFSDGSFASPVAVDLFGQTESDWALSQLTAMFFDYELSRVYYTLAGDSRLLYRAFTPDTLFFGNDEFVATEQGDILWNDVSGMDVIDGHLYFTRSDGTLYRADINGASVISGTTVAIDNGRDWDNNLFAFLSGGDLIGQVPVAEIEFESSGSQTNGRFRTFEFEVAAGEPVDVRLDWVDPSAQVNLFVRDASGTTVASDSTSVGSPKFVTAPAGAGGTYSARVLVREGATSYTLQINPVEGAPEPPPALADFVFASSGSNDSGRFQRFDFDVIAGELVEAQVIWDDASADVRVFLRDETNTLIERDLDGNGSSLITTLAETTGTWSVAVLTNTETEVSYDVLVDTDSDFTVPEPLAEFEFRSTGSNDSGRFQRFDFDVVAGETIDAQVIWDNLDADLRIFLRDENNNLIVRDTDGSGSPAIVSTIAATSGEWSLAVLADSDTPVDYDVLIDTTDEDAPVNVPPPVVTNIALTGNASQSSTAFGGVASRAIDGNTSGVYNQDSVTHTANSNQPMWQVLLSDTSTIESIVLFNRTDNCCTSRLTNYTVSILDDNGTTLFSEFFSDAPDPSNTIVVGSVVDAATVRVELQGNNAVLSLAEVQVFGYAQ